MKKLLIFIISFCPLLLLAQADFVVNCNPLRGSGKFVVGDDLIGKFSEFTPKFVKKYADVKSLICESVKQYINDVKTSKFPEEKHVFSLKPEELVKVNDYFNK